MIEIEKIEAKLTIKYYFSDYFSNDWIKDRLDNNQDIFLSGVFNVNQDVFLKKTQEVFGELPEYYFVIGELEDGYYKVDKNVFGLKNTFFFHELINLNIDHFVATSKISILSHIDQHLEREIYIGGEREEILPYEEFEKLIGTFPTSYEINLYREAKVTSILMNYFDNIPDKETKYQTYLNKKTPLYKSKLRKSFKESEIIKYETLLDKLQQMLNNENTYTENQWQEEILQFVLLIFPKYITVFSEMRFKDIDNNKTRRLDFGLIDFRGNLDLIEIKKPFDNSLVSKTQYRDNHIPNRDLSGTIMQIEKYIYYLNKSAQSEEKKLSKKYKDQLPEGLDIKIINPNAIIIMGRDNNLNLEQLKDLEIIKRKYKNLIDILTYDDLLRRLEITIKQLKQIE